MLQSIVAQSPVMAPALFIVIEVFLIAVFVIAGIIILDASLK